MEEAKENRQILCGRIKFRGQFMRIGPSKQQLYAFAAILWILILIVQVFLARIGLDRISAKLNIIEIFLSLITLLSAFSLRPKIKGNSLKGLDAAIDITSKSVASRFIMTVDAKEHNVAMLGGYAIIGESESAGSVAIAVSPEVFDAMRVGDLVKFIGFASLSC